MDLSALFNLSYGLYVAGVEYNGKFQNNNKGSLAHVVRLPFLGYEQVAKWIANIPLTWNIKKRT